MRRVGAVVVVEARWLMMVTNGIAELLNRVTGDLLNARVGGGQGRQL